MSIPFKVTGAGNKNAANVFKVVFSQALALPPTIEAWDNSSTFPVSESCGKTTVKQIFTGTAGNSNIPMLYAVATTSAAPGLNWKPASATVGSATKNRLKGRTNYVTNPTTPSAGGHILFNLGLEIPYDAESTAGEMEHMFQIRFFYGGSAPTVTIYGNTGTEISPSWSQITSSQHGLRFCDVTVEGTYELTLPQSGTVDAQEIWVTSQSTISATVTGNTNLKKTSVSATAKGDLSLKAVIAATATSNTNLQKTVSSTIKGDSNLITTP